MYVAALEAAIQIQINRHMSADSVTSLNSFTSACSGASSHQSGVAMATVPPTAAEAAAAAEKKKSKKSWVSFFSYHI